MISRRSLGIALPLALGATLAGSATALADITGTVATTAGAPLKTSVGLYDATGERVALDFPDAQGAFALSLRFVDEPGPYTVRASETDRCRDTQDPERERTATSEPVADGAVIDLRLDLLPFCEERFVPSSVAPPGGIVDVANGRLVGAPGSRIYVDVPVPFGAEGVAFRLPDGQVVGGYVPGQSRLKQVTLPTPAYNGPFLVTYTDDGLPVSYTVGNIESRTITRSPAFPGAFDLINIVDISGSMSSNDRGKRRADAVELVLGLSRRGDKVGAIGFDSKAKNIFNLTLIKGEGTGKALARKARKRIVNRGGTDYDTGLAAAYRALTRPGVSQARPKAAIFLTDGAHNGTYDNTHLRFAFNDTGRAWPICVVQLGRSFRKGDKARLKRIARETGGIYVSAPSNAKLNDVYFQCRGTTSGDRTFARKSLKIKKGQTKVLRKNLPAKMTRATFFAGWSKGSYTVNLIDPRGRKITPAKAKRMKAVSLRAGRSFTFYTVKNPRKGAWRIQVTPRKLSGVTRVSTTISGRRK